MKEILFSRHLKSSFSCLSQWKRSAAVQRLTHGEREKRKRNPPSVCYSSLHMFSNKTKQNKTGRGGEKEETTIAKTSLLSGAVARIRARQLQKLSQDVDQRPGKHFQVLNHQVVRKGKTLQIRTELHLKGKNTHRSATKKTDLLTLSPTKTASLI